MYCLQFQGIPQ